MILWTDEACVTREGMFNVHKSHVWARENPHANRERGYQVRFGDTVRAGKSGNFSYTCLLPGRLTAEWYPDSTQTVEDGPLHVWQSSRLQHDGDTDYVRQQFKATYSRRWTGHRGTIFWPPRSPDLWWVFSSAHTWKSTFMQSLAGLSKISWEDFTKQPQRSVRSCSGVFAKLFCAAWPSARNDGGPFEHLLEGPTVWPFDSLHHLKVTCILNTRRCTTHISHYFRLAL
jgi:hypothetical protein